MMHLTLRFPVVLVVALSLGVGGCRDASRILQSSGQPVPRAIAPRAIVTTSGANAVVTLVLDVRGDVGKIGSFTGRLRYDPAVLTYDGDVALTDGTLRASNPALGEIRVAGASVTGVDVARLAVFRFIVKDASALRDVRFEIDELHELSHADLRASVQGAGAPGVSR